MAGMYTTVSANLAYAKNSKKKAQKGQENLESALRFLTSVAPSTVKAGIDESKPKAETEEEKKKKKAKYGIAGSGYSANADKVLKQIKGK